MGMTDKAAYQELAQANISEPQAQVVALHILDWSQFATRDDLTWLEEGMRQLESRLVLWMVGIFPALLRCSETIALNFTAMVSALQDF